MLPKEKRHLRWIAKSVVAFGMALPLVLVSSLTTLMPPSPCETRVLLDANAEYNVNTAEVERLLEENGFPCPYVLDVTIWSQADLDWVLFKLNRASLGLYTVFPNGHHMISIYVINDLYLEETPGHDFSTLNSLLEVEWGNWIILHELGHMIWNGMGLDYSNMTELWCDRFANENYSSYSIIERGK